MSNFFANNTTCQLDPDSSRVDFPKFGSLPQLPPAIVLDGQPLSKSPPGKSQSSECSDARSMLSELEISDTVSRDETRRVSSDFSVTTRNPSTANSCSTLASNQVAPTISDNSNYQEDSAGTLSIPGVCEYSMKSPPQVNRVVTPDLSSVQLDSTGLSADATLPRELAQLSRWIGNSMIL